MEAAAPRRVSVGTDWAWAMRHSMGNRGARTLDPAMVPHHERVTPPPPPAALDDLLDVNAAAKRLGVSVKRVYQIADKGRIGTRHGTRWRFTPHELDAYRGATRRQGGRPRKRS